MMVGHDNLYTYLCLLSFVLNSMYKYTVCMLVNALLEESIISWFFYLDTKKTCQCRLKLHEVYSLYVLPYNIRAYVLLKKAVDITVI